MSDVVSFEAAAVKPEDTEALAVKLGESLKGGEVIELSSDLGGGKTTFVRGLVRGMGSEDKVASPTFTISRIYSNSKRRIHHFDFYRLDDPGLMAAELYDAIHSTGDVVVVEWANIVHDVLPFERLTVKFDQAQEGRTLSFSTPKKLEYLIKAVKA